MVGKTAESWLMYDNETWMIKVKYG